MGYTTYFSGSVEIVPPLNQAEAEYLRCFAESRRMKRTAGAYFADPGNDSGQGARSDEILDYNAPPEGQPGLWCQWVPTEDGSALEWDEGEKFYESAEWMAYLVDHFLKPGAEASKSGDPQFVDFTFDHVCNGVIEADGEDSDDRWRIVVCDNVVTAQDGRTVYEGDASADRLQEVVQRVEALHADAARYFAEHDQPGEWLDVDGSWKSWEAESEGSAAEATRDAYAAVLALLRGAPAETVEPDPFEGDQGAQLIRDTLSDRGREDAGDRMLAFHVEHGGDWWMDHVGPMIDRVEDILYLGDCEKCGTHGVDFDCKGADGLSVCDDCRDAEAEA